MEYRAAALGASEWLLGQAIDTGDGWAWPENPGEGGDHSLYGGGGVVLTMLDAHAASGDDRFLDAARRGADRLVARAQHDEYVWSGLYVGMAGVGFVLGEVGRADGVDLILERLRQRGHSKTCTDIIAGEAGTICWLDHVGERDMARARAQWLVDVAEPVAGGLRWSYDVTEQEYMPNFSHGGAGIGYALFRVGFDDAARAAAGHLCALAERPDGGFRVRHFDDGKEPDFPLGWCHGPCGTARLFHALGESELRDACAHTVRTSGIPARREPGFWDNVAPCCGSAGVAKFFLDLHRVTHDPGHLAFVRVLADDVVARATVDDAGVRWSNIEFRAQEPVLPPGVGYMQGAAGIASLLFELDRFLNGDGSYRRWPDNPF